MITCTETPQLHLLAIFNFPCIAIAPLHRHIRVRIRIHQHIEGAITRIKLRQERDRRCDLPEDGLDLLLNFLLRLLWGVGRFAGFAAPDLQSLIERSKRGLYKGDSRGCSILLVR